MRSVRDRPLLAAALAFMHFPIFMGLWVMATEMAADVRARLERGGRKIAALRDDGEAATA